MDEGPKENSLIDLKFYFSKAYKIDFDTYSKQVEETLATLISSEISNYKYSDVFVVGRKGINLFQPYIKKIKGNLDLQGIFAIQLFSFSEHPFVKIIYPIRFSNYKIIQLLDSVRKKFLGNTILLTDAINSGNEISEVIDNINPKNITKVCGYLANKNGLSLLQKKYPKIQFSFPRIMDDDNYTIEQDNLQHIYHSRLIPIDGDHPYRIYSLKYQIDIDDLIVHIDRIINKFKSIENPDVKKDILIVPHISSYTINLNFNAFLNEYPDLKQDLFTIERFQMRIKFDPKISQLRIMVLALDIINSASLTNGDSIKYKQCGLKFLDKLCESIHLPTFLKDNPPEKICPLCVDNYISNLLLSHVERELVKFLEREGVKIEKMYQYDLIPKRTAF
jgi:hypothetical protein